jgi:hypothetical protein
VIKNAMSMMTDDEDATIVLVLLSAPPEKLDARSEIKMLGKRTVKIPSERSEARFI